MPRRADREPKTFGIVRSRAYRLVKRDYDVRRRLTGEASLVNEIVAARRPDGAPARTAVARLARALRRQLRAE